MARLLLDQLEQDQPQLAPVEHPPPASAFAAGVHAPDAERPGTAAAPAAAARPAMAAAAFMAALMAAVVKSKSHLKSFISES
jgi:hypothetical protein